MSKFAPAASSKHDVGVASNGRADSLVEVPKWYESPLLTAESSNLKAASALLAASSAKNKGNKRPAPTAARVLPTTVEALKDKAIPALEDYIASQSKSVLRKANVQWIEEMLASGTLTDKISALTLQIKNAPYQSLRYLDSLLALGRKKGRRETALAVDALKDLFANELLPTTRKLRAFGAQPWASTFAYYSQHPQATPLPAGHLFLTAPPDAMLALWYLEDGIKTRYGAFLDLLEDGLFEALPHIKRARVNAVYELLSERPEAEERLLALLVNKMGDTDRKIAAKTHFLLSQLLDKNPGMKIAVVKEVERLLFRPHVKPRAQYFCLCFMNQLLFTPGDFLLAQALIGIYFALFKLLAANLIKGAEVPAGKKDGGKHKGGKDGKRQRHNKSQVSTRIALSSGELATEDTDAGLSKKMLGALLTGVNRAFPYARNAAAGADVAAVDRVLEGHASALFDVAAAQDSSGGQGYFSVVIQALVLLHQIMLVRDTVETRFFSVLYRALLNPELLTTSKTMLFMNLLYKTMRRDTNTARVLAFAKRLLQVSLHASPAFACASLFLLHEIAKSQPVLTAAVRRADKLDAAAIAAASGADAAAATAAEESKSSSDASADAGAFLTARVCGALYDVSEGDPMFSRADATALWELPVLAQHFHPSVALFASHLLRGEPIVYTGNPLTDFSRAAFLDRFVKKQPKARGDAAVADDDDVDVDSAFAGTRAAERAARRALVGPASLHRPAAKVFITAAPGARVRSGVVTAEAAENKFRTVFAADRAALKAERGGPARARVPRTEEEEDAFVTGVMEKEMARLLGHKVRRAVDDEMDDNLGPDFDFNGAFDDADEVDDSAGAEGDAGEGDGAEGDIVIDGGDFNFDDSDEDGELVEDEEDAEAAQGSDDDEVSEEEESDADLGPKGKRARADFTAKGVFDDSEGSGADDDDEEDVADDSDAEEARAMAEMMGGHDSDDDDDDGQPAKGKKDKKPASRKAAKKGGDESDTDDEMGAFMAEVGHGAGSDSDDDEAFGASAFASAEEFADLLEGSGENANKVSDERDALLAKFGGFTGQGYGKTRRGNTLVDRAKLTSKKSNKGGDDDDDGPGSSGGRRGRGGRGRGRGRR